MVRMPYSFAWHKPGGVVARQDSDWYVSYSDLMSLLLCLFALMVMMSPPPKVRDSRLRSVLASLQSSFGASAQPGQPAGAALSDRLTAMTLRAESISGGNSSLPVRATCEADGVHVIVAGEAAFPAGAMNGTRLSAEASERLRELARTLRHEDATVELQAFADCENGSDNLDDAGKAKRHLAAVNSGFARANAVAGVLAQCGVAVNRLQIVGPRITTGLAGGSGTRVSDGRRVDVVVSVPSESGGTATRPAGAGTQ